MKAKWLIFDQKLTLRPCTQRGALNSKGIFIDRYDFRIASCISFFSCYQDHPIFNKLLLLAAALDIRARAKMMYGAALKPECKGDPWMMARYGGGTTRSGWQGLWRCNAGLLICFEQQEQRVISRDHLSFNLMFSGFSHSWGLCFRGSCSCHVLDQVSLALPNWRECGLGANKFKHTIMGLKEFYRVIRGHESFHGDK
jgi:hypothetical protein